MDIEQAIREYLPQIVHMSLGTSRDNKPWVCEVHFGYDENLNLYYRSLTSRRHSQEIADNPSVAGTIVKQHALGVVPLGIYFEGTAKLLETAADKDAAFACMKDRLSLDEGAREQADDPEGHQFYKITVSNFYVFGKIDDEGVKKHELAWNGDQR